MAAKSGKSESNAVGIKETLTSLIIAFMLAFLFRGFVVEGFQIPTGSMAPTLLGKHVRFTNEYNGYDWAVGPWHYAGRGQTGGPLRNQSEMQVTGPMTGMTISETNRRLAAGDRVFVLKYLPLLQNPSRWDVVVFKNPGTHENYIKRLVGMPGEQVAIVDGDIFSRPFIEGQTALAGWESWTAEDWSIARKPERVQRTMFQDVFNSRYAVSDPSYRSPFDAADGGWEGVRSGTVYRFAGAGSTALEWNGRHPITDINPYNQTRHNFDLFTETNAFPVSDVAVSLNIETDDQPVRVTPVIETRGLVLRAVIDTSTGSGSVEMRSADEPDAPWTGLDSGSFSTGDEGTAHRIEFWHVDQALWLFIDGDLVAGGPEEGAYEMTPARRLEAATGRDWEDLAADPKGGDGVRTPGIFARPSEYRKPAFRWEFMGSGFTVSNVRVQSDIAYQVNPRTPTRGGHPMHFPTLSGEQFFMCGDNSANSLDSRLWDEITPWVQREIDDTPGVVNRDLIVGKAFVVYFPAPLDDGPLLTPDIGRMRWIW